MLHTEIDVNTALVLTSEDGAEHGEQSDAKTFASSVNIDTLNMVGLSFRHAPIEIRERLAFDAQSLPQVLTSLVNTPHIGEAVLVNTCNRVELYVQGKSSETLQFIESIFARQWHAANESSAPANTSKDELPWLAEALVKRQGIDALKHLMTVASSLDSQIVGEPQVLGQVKDAYLSACAAGSAGALMHYAFQQALKVAKRVRTNTAIAEHAVTLGFAAKELADRIFGPTKKLHAIVLGTGDMAESCVKHLLKKGHTLSVVSRSKTRAEAFSKVLDAEALSLEHLAAALPKADLVIASTTTAKPILTEAHLKAAMKKRRHSPTLYIDLGVPRNIEPLSQAIEGAYLYNVDDLHGIVRQNTKHREHEADIARQIIDEEIVSLSSKIEEQRATKLIVELKMRAEHLVSQELKKAKILLAQHGELNEIALHHMLLSLSNKLLHQPIIQMKNLAQKGPAASQELELAAQLFGLNK